MFPTLNKCFDKFRRVCQRKRRVQFNCAESVHQNVGSTTETPRILEDASRIAADPEEWNEAERLETTTSNGPIVMHSCSLNLPDAVWTAARLHGSDTLYGGLFDSIGGPECARAVGALSADYAAAAHMSPALRQESGSLGSLATHLAGVGCSDRYLPIDLRLQHADALGRLLREETGWSQGSATERFGRAMLRLDDDLCSAALPSNDPCCVPYEWAGRLASSGAVGSAFTLAGRDLRLAQVGNCAAVIGSNDSNQWNARQPLMSHTIENGREVLRLIREHPSPMERSSLFCGNRLLGELEPLRAFGRVKFKWPAALLSGLPRQQSPPNYRTPPYLTAEPEVLEIRLDPADRFLLLGTASLWQALEPEDAVRFVGDRLQSDGDEANLASELVRHARFIAAVAGDPPAGLAAVVIQLPHLPAETMDQMCQSDEEVSAYDDRSRADGG